MQYSCFFDTIYTESNSLFGGIMTLIIRKGKIFDAVHENPYIADICVKDGKIAAVGEDLNSEDEEVLEIDAEGLEIYPGFVEAHGHIGLDGYGIGFEGQDYNEMGDIISPSSVPSMEFSLLISHFAKLLPPASPVLQPVPAVPMFSEVRSPQSRHPVGAWMT